MENETDDNFLKIYSLDNCIKKLKEKTCDRLIKNDYDIEKIKYNLNILKGLENDENNECNICKNKKQIYGITKCFHLFCIECIFKQLYMNDIKCAICREENLKIDNITFMSKNVIDKLILPNIYIEQEIETNVSNQLEIEHEVELEESDTVLESILNGNENLSNRLTLITNNLLLNTRNTIYEEKLDFIKSTLNLLYDQVNLHIENNESIDLMFIKNELSGIINHI